MEKVLFFTTVVVAVLVLLSLIRSIVKHSKVSFNSLRLDNLTSEFLMQRTMRAGRRTFFKFLFLLLYWAFLLLSPLCGLKFWIFFALGLIVPSAVIALSGVLVILFYLLWRSVGLILGDSLMGIGDFIYQVKKIFKAR